MSHEDDPSSKDQAQADYAGQVRAIRIFNGQDTLSAEIWYSFEAVEYATLEWVDWFSNRRLLEPIGNIPPGEAEATFYATLETAPMAA